MKNRLCRMLLAAALLLSGCAMTTPASLVEQNTFIAPDHPELKIQVSNEIPFRNTARQKITPPDAPKSTKPVTIRADSHLFSDPASGRIIKISLEKLIYQNSKWEICLPDFSEFEDTIHTGPVKKDGILFSTGTFLFSLKNDWFLGRTYARVFGWAKDNRLQIHYTEKIESPTLSPLSIEAFHNRADKSFRVESTEENQTAARQ